MKVHKNDTVVVLTGDDRGKRGRIVRVHPEKETVVVQGVNLVWKHLRRSQDHPRGARIQKETPLPACRVMVVCPSCDKPTRVGHLVGKDGRSLRACKKCKQPLTTAV